MENKKFLDYAVVKISPSNQTDLSEYECIPSCWILMKDDCNNQVIFRYPSEDKISTSLRIIEQHPIMNEWPIYVGKFMIDTG